jgi:hypothetical protein
MRFFRMFITALLAVSLPALASVKVSSPKNDSTVTSPVHFVASATAPSCSKGVRSMGIYASNNLIYSVNGNKLNTTVALATGSAQTTVEEWDKCGGHSQTEVNFTVASDQVKVSITANPSSIVAGNSASLKVTASNATQVSVAVSGGGSLTLGATGGTLTVTPATTTTYTATATGASGEVSANATITVNQPPTVSISADPSAISAGGSSTLQVSAANATQVKVNGSDGSLYTLGSTGGAQLVSPSSNTTYTATAIGPYGEAYAATTVTLIQPTTVSINANPASIALGTVSNLTVTATSSTSVTINGSDGSTYTLPLTGGSILVNPIANTTYTVTATAAEGNVTATANVSVESAPNVLSNLQTSTHWRSWGQLPPLYVDCSPCSGIDWSMEPGNPDPTLSGNATEFDTSGTVGYAGVLWINSVTGQLSTQGTTDSGETLVSTFNNYTYDTDFYVTNALITQALEFDVAVYFGGVKMFWGTQCVELGSKHWDYVDNVTKHWVSTGFPCNLEDGWNHLTLQFRRLPGNELQYSSITLNGVTAFVNDTSGPGTVPTSWYGIDVNYQMDGDKTQASNTTYLDNLTLTYW